MELISPERRNELLWAGRPFLKLEFRDRYAIDDDLFAAWRRGDKKAVTEYFAPWLDQIAVEVAAGRRLRRVRIVSEPLSKYQRTLLEVSDLGVDAGEELRWLPRRLVSNLPLPGNDCFVFDDFVIFNVLDGNDERVEIQLHREPETVEFCRNAFESAWDLATPHHEYKPT
jgi:hypothetical protein